MPWLFDQNRSPHILPSQINLILSLSCLALTFGLAVGGWWGGAGGSRRRSLKVKEVKKIKKVKKVKKIKRDIKEILEI